MAAIVEFRSHPRTAPVASGRPVLRVIEGGRSPVVRSRRRTFLRRRLAVAFVVVAVAVVAVQLVGGLVAGGSPSAGAAAPAVHVVRAGDTMWSVAAEVAPHADRRAAVDELARANGGVALRVGQVLEVPGSLRPAR